MTEAQWALFTVLDGYQRHDLYDIMAGLDEEEVSRVWAAYKEACNLHNKNENNPTKDKASQLKAVREQLLQIMTVDEQDSYGLVLCALNDHINDVESGWMDN